jgi:O-antigen ligase
LAAPAIAAESTRRERADSLAARLAGPALAFSLNGFFLYLGVLDLAGVAPRTATTGAYYALVGGVVAALAWANRATLSERVRTGGRTLAVFAIAALGLGVWFEVNAALLSEGSVARRFAALLLLWTGPTALLALSLTRRQLEEALWTLCGLGLFFVAIDLVALADDPHGDRFSPIDELDPITAAHVPALAAVACLALRPQRPLLRRARPLALFLLVAFAVVPGSRGPLVALAVATATVLVLTWRATGPRAVAAVVAAVALGAVTGSLLASQVGSTRHLTSAGDAGETGPISSLHIRRQLFSKALRAVPDEPLVGNGVGALVDDTPEAHRMGIAGRHTYPHNTFIEAAYSLGLPGLVLFAAALAAAAWALLRLRLGRGGTLHDFAVAFFLFALVNSSLSNELGSDVWLWTAAALAVSLFAGQRPASLARRR